jgi:dTDP-4-amino-4,6-dideoxygalactose transaminase
LKPGDEVIVPAFTWVSTANVVEYMGAHPVFCDIQLDTFNIDVAALEALITPRTVGIIPVHLFGLCADMDPLMAIAKTHRLWIIEDAACGLGGFYAGKHSGTFGEMGCFSFHPRKSITTGEGGMITTTDDNLDKLLRSLRDHGASRSDHDRHKSSAAFLLSEYRRLGYNFRLTDIQGALGCAQMDRLEWILSERARRARFYDQELADVQALATPIVPDGYIHGYQSYVCLFRPEEPTINNVARLHERRNQVMTKLEEQGIATRQGTHAAALQGYYADKYGLQPQMFPNSFLAQQLSMALPLYPQMTDDEQEFVLAQIKIALT